MKKGIIETALEQFSMDEGKARSACGRCLDCYDAERRPHYVAEKAQK